MLTFDLFRRYLFSHHSGALVRKIAWVCLTGIALGVFSLSVVVNVMNGFHEDISARLLSVEPHLVVQWATPIEAEEIVNSEVFKSLQEKPGIFTEVVDQQDVILRTVDGYFGGAIAKGVSAKSFQDIRHRLEVRSAREVGAPIPEVDPDLYQLVENEVAVGADLARSLAIVPGDRLVVIPPETLLLPAGEVPIYDTVVVREVISSNVADIDAKGLFYLRNHTLLRLKRSASRLVSLEVRLADPHHYQALEKSLERQGVIVESWVERNSSLFFALQLEKTAISVFLGLSTLIASFAIVTVLVLLMTQKRRDIGILMSMGLSRRRTVRVFTGLGILLSGIGIMLGLFLGLGLSLYLQFFPLNLLPDIYYNSRIPARIDPLFMLGVAVFSVILALGAAWFPASTHVKRNPVEALRGPII